MTERKNRQTDIRQPDGIEPVLLLSDWTFTSDIIESDSLNFSFWGLGNELYKKHRHMNDSL